MPFPPLPTSLPPPSSSPSYLGLEGPPHQVLEVPLALGVLQVQHAPPPMSSLCGSSLFPLPGCNLCSCHTGIKNKPANKKLEWHHESHVVFVLDWLSCISKILTQVQAAHFTTLLQCLRSAASMPRSWKVRIMNLREQSKRR